MQVAQQRARFDWLVELGGASALAGAAGFAAFKAAPSLGWPGPATMIAGGFAFFALGIIAMRAVKPAPCDHSLASFAVAPIMADELLLTDEVAEPLLLEDIAEDDVLLLEDRLGAPGEASRVIQLFAGEPVPRAGEHAPGPTTPTPPDATKALFAALDELKRSLR